MLPGLALVIPLIVCAFITSVWVKFNEPIASDVGEAFRPVVPPWVVTAAYGVSWAYLIGDVSFTTYKSSQLGPSPIEAANMSERTRLAMVAVKRSVFQAVASMALPAFTIHTAVKYAGRAFAKSQNATLRRWGPTAVGIGIVPALPYLFDHPVSSHLHSVALATDAVIRWSKPPRPCLKSLKRVISRRTCWNLNLNENYRQKKLHTTHDTVNPS